MKSKQAPATFLVPRTLGRSESDMVAHGYGEQLDLFRETLTRTAKLQIVAMMALSDPKHWEREQIAKVADILRAMGYEPELRTEGIAYPTWMYEKVEETGLRLRRKSCPFFIREPSGFTKDGRRKWKTGIVDLSIFQEFGFYYEDSGGQPIDLADIPKDQLIEYAGVKGDALYAIPMLDDNGNVVLNKDGTPRRRMANAVTWTFSSRIAKLLQDPETRWIFHREAIAILQRYQKRPASFDLIFKTLFWTGTGPIEMSHDKLVGHLGIKSKDRVRVQKAIDAAFEDMLAEGIIDKAVTVRESGYYQPTKKTGRSRRVDKVYQWKRSSKWNLQAKALEAVTAETIKALPEGKTESRKE